MRKEEGDPDGSPSFFMYRRWPMLPPNELQYYFGNLRKVL